MGLILSRWLISSVNTAVHYHGALIQSGHGGVGTRGGGGIETVAACARAPWSVGGRDYESIIKWRECELASELAAF